VSHEADCSKRGTSPAALGRQQLRHIYVEIELRPFHDVWHTSARLAQQDALASERALAPSTALLALILNQIFRFAVRRGLIGVDSVGQLEAGEKPRCSSRAGCSPHAETLLTPE